MDKRTITLKVNNTTYHVTTFPARRLLDVLRDDLGLGSVREGCGMGVCGACTVLVDGVPLSSCLLLVAQVEGKSIQTTEGLGAEGELHPVQQAFIQANAFQCAYCTPGFVLLTVALLEKEAHPDAELLREYIGANLCRCGSYRNILQAAETACKLKEQHQ